jgi:hypothetical protein
MIDLLIAVIVSATPPAALDTHPVKSGSEQGLVSEALFAKRVRFVTRTQAGGSGNSPAMLMQQFIADSQMLNRRINTSTVTDADNDRIEREVEDYRALADRMTDGRYDALPDTHKQVMLQGLRMNFDSLAASTADEIAFANGLITGIGTADAAYNYLIVHDAYLYAGDRLFAGEPAYARARGTVAVALSGLGGSRQGARNTENAAELAAARSVRMPAAVTRDPAVIEMFRRAWATGGIPWDIVQINPTSGWYDKVEYGRVVGQLRDAAIAARDPNNPQSCNLYDFTMFRDSSGNVRRSSHSTRRIACENIE